MTPFPCPIVSGQTCTPFEHLRAIGFPQDRFLCDGQEVFYLRPIDFASTKCQETRCGGRKGISNETGPDRSGSFSLERRRSVFLNSSEALFDIISNASDHELLRFFFLNYSANPSYEFDQEKETGTILTRVTKELDISSFVM